MTLHDGYHAASNYAFLTVVAMTGHGGLDHHRPLLACASSRQAVSASATDGTGPVRSGFSQHTDVCLSGWNDSDHPTVTSETATWRAIRRSPGRSGVADKNTSPSMGGCQ